MLGAAAVLTTRHRHLRRLRRGRRSRSRTALAALAGDAFEDGDEPDAAKAFAETLVRIGPAAIAGSTLLMLCVNLYAAARSTQLSHRLRTAVAGSADFALRLPWPLGVVAHRLRGGRLCPARSRLAISLRSAPAGSAAAFVLQGLAVAHALSRGLKLRLGDAGRPLRLLRPAGEIHASRPRARSASSTPSPGCAPRAAFLPTPKPTIQK